jgi:hypothetical protein
MPSLESRPASHSLTNVTRSASDYHPAGAIRCGREGLEKLGRLDVLQASTSTQEGGARGALIRNSASPLRTGGPERTEATEKNTNCAEGREGGANSAKRRLAGRGAFPSPSRLAQARRAPPLQAAPVLGAAGAGAPLAPLVAPGRASRPPGTLVCCSVAASHAGGLRAARAHVHAGSLLLRLSSAHMAEQFLVGSDASGKSDTGAVVLRHRQ